MCGSFPLPRTELYFNCLIYNDCVTRCQFRQLVLPVLKFNRRQGRARDHKSAVSPTVSVGGRSICVAVSLCHSISPHQVGFALEVLPRFESMLVLYIIHARRGISR